MYKWCYSSELGERIRSMPSCTVSLVADPGIEKHVEDLHHESEDGVDEGVGVDDAQEETGATMLRLIHVQWTRKLFSYSSGRGGA